MTIIKNSLDTGTSDGATVSAASTGGPGNLAFNTVNSGGATVLWSADRPMPGRSWCVRMTRTSGTTQPCLVWTPNPFGASPPLQWWSRAYIRRITALPAGGFQRVMQTHGTSPTVALPTWIYPTGAMMFWASTGTMPQSTAVAPLDAWCRVEWEVIAAASPGGRVEMRIFENPNATEPTQALYVGSLNTQGAPTHFVFGDWGGQSNWGTIDYSQVAISDEGWIGPEGGAEPGTPARAWDGTAWRNGGLWAWSGTGWVRGKTWDGTQWKTF